MLSVFVSLDSDKKGMQKGEPQSFRDCAWQGLPMDNQASDVLIPIEFTETWIPLGRTRDVMTLLQTYFTEPKDAGEAYARTGTNAWELYYPSPRHPPNPARSLPQGSNVPRLTNVTPQVRRRRTPCCRGHGRAR